MYSSMNINSSNRSNISSHYWKIFVLFFIGHILVSYYRPFQNDHEFFDFGLADSGVGFVSLIMLYLLFTPPYKNRVESVKNLKLVLSVYLSQEIYCYFYPGFFGTFDFKDLIYYIFSFYFIFLFDIKARKIIGFL